MAGTRQINTFTVQLVRVDDAPLTELRVSYANEEHYQAVNLDRNPGIVVETIADHVERFIALDRGHGGKPS